MADISKINPNGTEYNLKDATARAGIESSKTIKSSIVTVTDAAPINAEDITVDITPIQDLHGYDHPWVGGAWKNKLPMTVDRIKVLNTSGTWSGNTYTKDGVSVTILSDNGGNVTGFLANGSTTASEAINFDLCRTTAFPTGSYILNGCPAGGGGGTTAYYIKATSGSTKVYDTGEGEAINIASSSLIVSIFIGSANNKTFYPMLRLSTETDPTFAPYSNICPIEGRTGAELDRVGKNWFDTVVDSERVSIDIDGSKIKLICTTAGTWVYAMSDYIRIIPSTTYTLSCSSFVESNVNNDGQLGIAYYQSDKTFIKRDFVGNNLSKTIITPSNVMYMRVYVFVAFSTTAAVGDYCEVQDIQLELGTQPTTYEPYQGQQYTANFGETVFGGKWHVTAGGTDKTHANIANYNGETINEPWLSSLDEYSPGATPTIGAQVVYPLMTPTTISTPKQNVPMLQGINTVSADCGDTSLKYQPDNVVGELKGEIGAVEAELAEVEENLEIVYEDHVANTSMGIIVDGYSVGDMPFSNALDIAKPGYIPIAVTDTSVVLSSVADQGEIATHCLLDVTNNRVRFYVHVMDSAASLTIPPNSLTFRVAYKKA